MTDLNMKTKILLKSLLTLLITVVGLSVSTDLYAQRGQENASGVFVDSDKGRQDWRDKLNVTGNQVESIVTNWGTIGDGNASINQAGVWPKGTGHGHLHEMTGLVATETENINGDLTPLVSDGYGNASSESGAQLTDPNTGWKTKFQPLPGYQSQSGEEPEIANSLNPNSWPDSWPDKSSEWNGLWNGYFGLNQFNADQEVFYVMDDSRNTEYRVYPFADDTTLGGLGLQIRVRLFQWSQALAKDILFMQYEVSNQGNIDYNDDINDNPIIFGGFTDINASGSGASDDAADFDQDLDVVYGWSFTGQGTWNQFRDIPPGYIGWKFLESPGISDDGIDNDNDGLLDESRDNDAGSLIFGPIGKYGPAVEHWEGDEDGDWNSLTDDVGSDGIGPDQDGYPGADADGTEGNGKPDQGEPNFGRLDNDESDQVGLTSFYAPAWGTVSVQNEETTWDNLQPGFFQIPEDNINQVFIFGSGPFSLQTGRSQRFSTCFVFGVNENGMFRSAQVAQRIYNSDYRFARPPLQPSLEAIAGDEKITLVWDEVAEFSQDPIYGRDFEGYRIIKSTDPQFNDAEDITDAFGNAVYKRSIAQFDKINGLTGYHPLQFGEEIGLANGTHYYMGDDTGLQHSYVDNDVINGRTYFYALIAYDAGYADGFYDDGISNFENLFPISPSESPASITEQQGVIIRYDKNTASARPNPGPSDFESGTLNTDKQDRISQSNGTATGMVKARAIDVSLLEDAVYTVSFDQQTIGSSVEYETTSFTIVDDQGFIVTDDEAIPTDLDGNIQESWSVEFLREGFVMEFENQSPSLNDARQRSGWTAGSQTTIEHQVDLEPTFQFPDPPVWPINAVIEIGDGTEVIDTAQFSSRGTRQTPVYFKVYEAGTENPVEFIFTESDSTENGFLEYGETITLAFKQNPGDSRFAQSWKISFTPPLANDGSVLPFNEITNPQPGDQFNLRNRVPFGERDEFTFNAVAGKTRDNLSNSILNEIQVVPNPYVAATITEKRPFLSGRGERRIEFRNLPTNARLRIYSASGAFVREIQPDNGLAAWDLLSKDGLEVAFGMYFYHVEAEGVGEKVGKFAIIN